MGIIKEDLIDILHGLEVKVKDASEGLSKIIDSSIGGKKVENLFTTFNSMTARKQFEDIAELIAKYKLDVIELVENEGIDSTREKLNISQSDYEQKLKDIINEKEDEIKNLKDKIKDLKRENRNLNYELDRLQDKVDRTLRYMEQNM